MDKVSCQSMSDLQISISFKKLRSFWIQICKAYFSKPLFRGRKFDLKFCTFLHYPKRGHYAFQVILFRSNGLINYRKIEYFWYTLISFGITPNFRSNLRPLNIVLEKMLCIFEFRMSSAFQNWSKFENQINFGKWTTLIYVLCTRIDQI